MYQRILCPATDGFHANGHSTFIYYPMTGSVWLEKKVFHIQLSIILRLTIYNIWLIREDGRCESGFLLVMIGQEQKTW